eukprot:CAMPEP_0115854728 /NCGR_PEP_ID=MMETSP0287-20121206/14176_1 /TAXON_ID=412157 /ORGANISM="Chrysochromulina rotalis, Strain UIO044" /LENGTH=179 /DNA_ID=CAMNT_0003308859 /DNA_START=26 /DNA_END=565 /DNA_ORIENTATION=+
MSGEFTSTVRKAEGVYVAPRLLTDDNPLGSFSDEIPMQTRRYYKTHPSTTSQLTGFGAPMPSETSNEDPLIQGRMRTFPDNHPSFGSVKSVAMGCPAIKFSQQDSSMWKSNTQSSMWDKEPTIKSRKEGKKVVAPFFGSGDMYTPPIESYVIPSGAPPTMQRDQRVFKHVGTLSRSGKW